VRDKNVKESGMKKVVGFIGLGKMGGPMARNILRAGFPLAVYDSSPAAMDALVREGAQACGSAAKVGQRADRVIMMLFPEVIEDVVLGKQGLLAGIPEGGTILDSGNCSPTTTKQLAKIAGERGVRYLDAAVSGGPIGSAAGTLSIMVGGDESAFRDCLPLLQAMGKRIVYMGGSGSGHLAKAINNTVVVATTMVIAEALAVGIEAGLDPAALTEALSAGSAASWVMNRAHELYTLPAKPGENGESLTEVGFKQIEWVGQAARDAEVPFPLATFASELYKLYKTSRQENGSLPLRVQHRLVWEIAGPPRESGWDG
jgi:3-hydroxyisobutyrate dehydrogenase-like beta-hydroxyacid dehydrogenase